MLQKNNILDLASLFASDPARASDFCLVGSGWLFDYSRLPLSREALRLRLRDSEVAALGPSIEALFGGRVVNPTEQQAALHMALRAPDPGKLLESAAAERLLTTRKQVQELAGRLYSGAAGLTDLVHIGIGGSDLGPRLVAEALDENDSAVRVHWLATVDRRRTERLFGRLDPAATGLVVASKSFGTAETLIQARAVIEWMGADWTGRSWAATANFARAREMGFGAEAIFEFPQWVGGRFSLWSPVGLAAAARIGPGRWSGLLAGAAEADEAVRTRVGADSFALMWALALDYLGRTCGYPTLGVVSYEPRLGLLAEYLQQLVMESLGKSVTIDGEAVSGPTAPLVFGGRGTDLQHSVFQALHQGTRRHPVVLAGSCRGGHDARDWQREQLAHLLAQARALVDGKSDGPPHERSPGNNPVLLLLAEELTPEALGWLLAGFEHAVYLLGRLWNINPFDQWGVEEGKRLASYYREALAGAKDPGDPVLDFIHRRLGRN